jgi:hypothetical protein
VIYIDSSVALARLFLEPRSPPERLWQERLVSSQLLEYEVWNRVHAYNLADQAGVAVQRLLMRINRGGFCAGGPARCGDRTPP